MFPRTTSDTLTHTATHTPVYVCPPIWALTVVVVAAAARSPDEFRFDHRHRLRCFPLSVHRASTPITV